MVDRMRYADNLTDVYKRKRAHGKPSSYRPEYAHQVFKWLASGHSLDSFCAQIMVSGDTIYRWKKQHEDFGEAIDLGRRGLQAYIEELIHESANQSADGHTDNGVPTFSKKYIPRMIELLAKNQLKWEGTEATVTQTNTTVGDGGLTAEVFVIADKTALPPVQGADDDSD